MFADKGSFWVFIMTSTNLHNQSSPYYVLYQYLIWRSMLDNILQILPDIVDFYYWIHKEFSGCLTKLEIKTMTIRQLLESDKFNFADHSDGEVQTNKLGQFLKLAGEKPILL